MKFKKLSLLLLLLAVVFTFSGCSATDLVAKVAVTSFDALAKAIPDQISYDSAKEGWAVKGLDGGDRIILSKDFSSNQPDIALELDAAPFLDVGLDVEKLPKDQYLYDASTGKITIPFEYGADKFGKNAEKSALDTFKQIVKSYRDIVGYHEEGDHYKIALGKGNLFAWAKDLSTNKTDIAFILNPGPWIKAGVDTGKIKEWVFVKMPMTDKNGKPSQVDVLMKGFNVDH